MLVLARRPGQVLDLDGGRIKVMVVRINGSIVRLGIEAPAAVDVVRGEVLDRGPGQRLPAVGRRMERIKGAKPRA